MADSTAIFRKNLSSAEESKSGTNILNKYRSYSYNFTLSAVRRSDVDSPKLYETSSSEFTILKTGGKTTTGFSEDVTGIVRNTYSSVRMEGDSRSYIGLTGTTNDTTYGSELVKSFNQQSPGRFDMFIDNVEINTLMAPTNNTGATLATNIVFDVFEPYSINGFIESLHVAAVAAGYLSYSNASFLLKTDFVGYPDDRDLKSPERVPLSTRYFLFRFSGIDVEVTERGTLYKCRGVPYHESALGQSNDVKTPIKMSGSTVYDVLTDFMNNLSSQLAKSDKESRVGVVANSSDRYFIKFPTRDTETDGGLNFDEINEIGKSPIVEVQKDPQLFSFINPDVSTYDNYDKTTGARVSIEKVKYNPTNSESQIQFREGAKVHEIISSVIRDSYIKDSLQNLQKDEYGFVNYFIIKTEIKNRDEIDMVSRKPFQDFTYIVLPYKVHITRIPGYSSQQIDTTKLKPMIARDYNYVYTGKNIDIINFKLSFNTLFFEALPKALANTDLPPGKDTAAKPDNTDYNMRPDNRRIIEGSEIPVAEAKYDTTPTSVQSTGGNAALPQDDPYLIIARNMHNAIIDSKASMISGDIEIIGDPFYLTYGNLHILSKNGGETKNGDADILYGDVLININFRNPTDIAPLSKGGTLYFDENKVSFSGIYRVTECYSSFKNGVFSQKLTILRIPGQIMDNTKPTDYRDKVETTTNEESQTTETTT